MTIPCSPKTLAAVEAVLPDCLPGAGLTTAEVYHRVLQTDNVRALKTVSHALRELVNAGRAAHDGPRSHYRYRKPGRAGA